MFVIPVVDLMRGRVVRAQRGDRQAYRPIVSALTEGSEPVTLARALLCHCASQRMYVADLDALMGGAAQADVLRTLLRELPDVEIWLDAGFAHAAAAQRLRERIGTAAGRIVPVFGSESLRTLDDLPQEAVLSLDRREGRPLDLAGCWDASERWPRRVIMMTLERVGADAGPDLATLGALRARSPGTQFIGAGGIRDVADLESARAAGAQGWLVASALHDGRLAPQGR